MNSELETALIDFFQTLTLLAEDVHVALVDDNEGYEAGQHLRASYDAGADRPKRKKSTTRRKGVRGN